MAERLTAGWGFPGGSRAHYFVDGELISLCGSWMYSGPREPDNGTVSPDDCARCRRAFERAAAQEVPHA